MFVKQTVKGMRDILPAEMELRESMLSKIKHIYSSFGYVQIETPCMEHIENLTGKQGGENEKLIFKIMKRGDKLRAATAEDVEELVDSGLRYDLTVPLSRYYANNAGQLTLPFKAMQIGSVWRADRPQKGRFRQFTQCDIDILGDSSNNAEIELIYATSLFLKSAGVRGCTVMINDRRLLKAMAIYSGFAEDELNQVYITLDKYDKIGAEGVRAELIRCGAAEICVDRYLTLFDEFSATDDKYAFCQQKLNGYLEDGVIDNLHEIITAVEQISARTVKLDFDPTLVRGMSYYTGVIFEIKSDDFAGSSIAGGGRYDEMIGKYSGVPVSACGFSIGFERLIAALLERGVGSTDEREKTAVLLSNRITAAEAVVMQTKCQQRRNNGEIVLLQRMNKNIAFQKKTLAAANYHLIEIFNEQDVESFL